MFGYVRPALSQLPQEDRDSYQGAYCGLCHAMGRRHGFLSRFTLNYDFAFLAILFTDRQENMWCERRCPAHPLRKKRTCLCGTGLDAAADASLILTWHKLRDDVLDKGWFRGLPARMLSFVFRRAYRQALAARPAFASQVESGLEQLHSMENAASPELDRLADVFAGLLKAAAPEEQDETRRRVLEQILYHVGRWIYLVDAWDDLQEDRKKGRFNPLDARFEGQPEKEREYLSTTMTHSLKLAISAANLTDFGRWEAVIHNMLYQGLPLVQEAVLSGRWKEIRNNTGR